MNVKRPLKGSVASVDMIRSDRVDVAMLLEPRRDDEVTLQMALWISLLCE